MKVRDAYEDISKYYDAHRNRSPYFRIIEDLTRRCFLENTQGKSFDRGLDIGCGTGRNLPLFMNTCREVRGMDYTPAMLEHAKREYANHEQVRLMIGDAQALPFCDRSFELVASFKALPHVPDIERALAEIHRVAKDGATIFTEFYSPYSFRKLLNRMKHYTKWHSVQEAKGLLEGAGFKVKQVYGLRTFIATEYLCYLPGAYRLFNYLENRFTHSALNRFSGYYIIVSEK